MLAKVTLTKWISAPQKALYGSGVAFDLKATVGIESSNLRIYLSHTPDPEAPLASGVKDMSLPADFQKIQGSPRQGPRTSLMLRTGAFQNLCASCT